MASELTGVPPSVHCACLCAAVTDPRADTMRPHWRAGTGWCRSGKLRAEFETSSAPGKVTWSVHAQSKTYIKPAHMLKAFGHAPVLLFIYYGKYIKRRIIDILAKYISNLNI